MEMWGIQDLCYLVINTVDFVSKLFSLTLRVSFAVGYLIMNYLLLAYEAVLNVVEVSVMVLKVVSEDFIIFLLDIKDKVVFVLTAITAALQSCCITVLECWENLGALVSYVCKSIGTFAFLVWDSILKIVEAIVSIPEIVKQAFILVGNEVWSFLNNIPLSIGYVCTKCMQLLGKYVEEIFYTVMKLTVHIFAAFGKIFRYGNDIPLESVAGVFMGVIIVCLTIKFWSQLLHTLGSVGIYSSRKIVLIVKKIMFSIVNLILYIFKKTAFSLSFLWRTTENIVLWLVTNQHIPVNIPVPEAIQENDVTFEEADDNTTDQVVESASTSEENTSRKLRRLLVEEQENKLCVVCQDKGKCVIIFPCRHLCLCSDCCDIIKNQHGACPICRQRVRRTMRVYV